MKAVSTIFLCFVSIFTWSSSSTLSKTYSDFLDPMVRDGFVAAYYLAVAQDGVIEVDRGLGANGAIDHVDPDKHTSFALFSLSKPLVSVAVLKLVDEGLVELDAPLSRYLPEFEGVRLEDGTDVGSALKVVNLFTHTAGFTHNKDFRGKGALAEMYQSENLFTLESISNENHGGSTALAEQVSKLASLPLTSMPGSRFEYSVSTDVLGRLAEVVSGKRLDSFLEETLFKPLAMEGTGFFRSENSTSNRAVLMKPLIRTFPTPGNYQRFEPHPPFSKGAAPGLGETVGLLSGGSGLLSNGKDMMRFADFLLNGMLLEDGTYFLSRELKSKFFTHQLSREMGDWPLAEKMPYAANDGLSLGLSIRPSIAGGIWDQDEVGVDFLYWSGFASSVLWIDVENNVAGIFLSQIRPAQQYLVDQLDDIADNFRGAGQ